jgi:hypothetical protein
MWCQILHCYILIRAKMPLLLALASCVLRSLHLSILGSAAWLARALLLAVGVLLSFGSQATPTVALHYGNSAAVADLKVFDIVVVEPDHGHDPIQYREQGTELYAYVSVAEVQSSRTYYPDIPEQWKMARNGHWDADVIDQTQAAWPDFFVNRVVAPLWARGYRGFFLDTLDSYRLAKQFDEAAQQDGVVRVIEALHRQFPGIHLILNRGFEVVPRVRDKVEMVAAESLYRGWNAALKRYEDVRPEDRAWLLAQLDAIHQRDGLPILAIDYVPPHDRAQARDVAQRIRSHGFIPWVTDSLLSTVGVGALEVMPRHVLVLYNGAEASGLNFTNAHRYLEMPLNHMGYIVDYVDVRQPLPQGIYRDRYAGIATWFSSNLPTDAGKALSRWLLARVAEGMPLAVMDHFGVTPDANWLRELGIQASNLPLGGAMQVSAQHPMMGFEVATPAPGNNFVPVLLSGVAQSQAVSLIDVQDRKGKRFVGGALMPWGGFVLAPYVMTGVPGTQQHRWVVDPFAFLAQALKLPDMPVPDVTTENGRRLLMAHIDGDGFASRSEKAGSPFAAQVLLDDVLKRYKLPHTVSVIEAEVSPDGLYPKLSGQLEGIARQMFRLPYVEVASHSYSHPFLWDTDVQHGVFLDDTQRDYHLAIPGYEFNVEREILGSVNYIRSRLAPANKPVQIILWSGDTTPGVDALAMADKAGLLNFNGGDTGISKSNPSLTAVRSHGIQKDGHLQVFAPITNENIYTNLWQGPFYGFERVIETFEMTNKPRRIKAVDIYYHTYSASKQAGLTALHKVYGWAQAQVLHPVYTSEYIRKVQDFFNYTVARDEHGWAVAGSGPLRTLRLPSSMGVPQLSASQHVAGYKAEGEGTYVHLSASKARVQLVPADAGAGGAWPYLLDANARLSRWQVSDDGQSVDFALDGHVPLRFSLAHIQGCVVRANQRVLPAVRAKSMPSGDGQVFQLSDDAANIQIRCTAH